MPTLRHYKTYKTPDLQHRKISNAYVEALQNLQNPENIGFVGFVVP